MLTRKTAKTITFTLAAAVGLSITLPAANSYAITVDQIFKQVGLERSTTSKPSQPSQPSQPSKPSTGSQEGSNSSTSKPSTSTNQNTALGDKLIASGEKYLGTPYKFGASSSTTAVFDCSSFVQRVFKENGISLPRSSRQQSTVGTTVSKANLQKGDLMFFTRSSTAPKIGHVGIYAGNGKVLHTYGKGGVKYSDINEKWLVSSYVTSKRVTK
ncbi:C40 family peptidase [Risungbinella massiliensis]|uniref:C40 family peptidase n=1 Tax=Risungbinella massiliensis TaxID=1329796 RepID=UPI0009E44E8E|nr:C40 family peptidase [Risungbinella massiliensis]